MPNEFAIDVHFYRLSEELSSYFTALYSFTIHCGEDVLIEDRLHPEWAAMRFVESGQTPIAGIVPQDMQATWPFVASGPTSRAIKFGLKKSRIWGLGLQPAGWAQFIPVPVRPFSDRLFDASVGEAFAAFLPISRHVRRAADSPDEMAQWINAFLMEMDRKQMPDEKKILACQAALRDPEISDVAMLTDRLRIGRRSVERLCSRYFGFPPKLLLRRQRFLRSLARFMLEPRHNWSKALDGQYFDQAHFVRDFRAFMGVTPSEYADAPRPILDRIMAQRMADQGVAPETDMPTVLRYTGKDKRGD